MQVLARAARERGVGSRGAVGLVDGDQVQVLARAASERGVGSRGAVRMEDGEHGPGGRNKHRTDGSGIRAQSGRCGNVSATKVLGTGRGIS